MLQQKGKRILIYFLLLFLVCSINNIKLNEIKFSNISDIKVLGLGNKNNDILYEKISNLNLGNIFSINEKNLINIIESSNLVEKYDVFKIYPSSLYINIQQTEFLARNNHKGINLIIGSNGKFIKNKTYEDFLPFIFGNPEIKKFLKFKEDIDKSKFKYKDIKNFYYFSTDRWDIELMNNVMIKLPVKNVKKTLDIVFDFLQSDIDNINIVDARIENQIILND